MKNLLSFIKKFFGYEAVCKPKVFAEELPLIYSRNFSFYVIEADASYILIYPLTNSLPFDIVLGVNRYLSRRTNNVLLNYLYSQSNNVKSLYQAHNLNYLCSDYDFYLSNKEVSNELINLDNDIEYTKTTQLVINFYLTHEAKYYYSSDIAPVLGVSPSSISRANEVLMNLEVLIKRGVNTATCFMVKSKQLMLEKTEPYWIRPYRHRIDMRLSKKDFAKIKKYTLYSGDTALGIVTTLSAGQHYHEVAISKKDFIDKLSRLEDEREAFDEDKNEDVYSFEEFIYDPHIFGKDETISYFDLYILMKQRYANHDDPRLNSALDEVRRMLIDER